MRNILFKFFELLSISNDSLYAKGIVIEGARIKTLEGENLYIYIDEELRLFKNYASVVKIFNLLGNISFVPELAFQKFPIGAQLMKCI